MRHNGVVHIYSTQAALPAAFGIALAATLGALFIGEVIGQMPCTLCWYQRIAMFPLVPLLGIATLRGDASVRVYAILLALIGLGFALWHSGLFAGIISAAIAPCTADGPSCTDQAQVVFGLPLPYLSAIAFAAIAANLSFLKGPRV